MPLFWECAGKVLRRRRHASHPHPTPLPMEEGIGPKPDRKSSLPFFHDRHIVREFTAGESSGTKRQPARCVDLVASTDQSAAFLITPSPAQPKIAGSLQADSQEANMRSILLTLMLGVSLGFSNCNNPWVTP